MSATTFFIIAGVSFALCLFLVAMIPSIVRNIMKKREDGQKGKMERRHTFFNENN